MTTMKLLMDRASHLGVRVQLAYFDDDQLLGHFDVDANLITIAIDLTAAQRKEAFAHELGHCFYADNCTTDENERRADKYAAQLLIDPNAYRAAELINEDVDAIAAELGQTSRMVRVFRKEVLPALSLSRRFRRWERTEQ